MSPKQQIEPTLALAIAGQVSLGLTPGDGLPRRQEAALVAIGLMVSQASDGDEVIEATLAMSERTEIERTPLGWRISRKPETQEG